MGDIYQERFWAKVNKSGDCWIWTGARSTNGYGRCWVDKKVVYAHRVSYEWTNGSIPEGIWIDHRCHNHACVRPDHLRAVTPKQNNENRCNEALVGVSGVRGVYFAANRWRANVKHNGRTRHIGVYNSMAEAEAAAIAKRNELFTHNDADRQGNEVAL